eukprot:TRINITY_DN7494_c0_g1_i1.p1 TRINITY_DN7494_c0_g1~~TRINITY_DN7494_c0_g1_i1.p1  ORF type:complete len:206 (-),score=30.67 TRINITY_DN7494_c0_g1_i1:105-722(-)
MYPSQTWNWERFSRFHGVWESPEKTRAYLDSLVPVLHIQTWEDWYRISRTQLTLVGASKLISHFGRLYNALAFAFPENPWDSDKFLKIRKLSTQRMLYLRLQELMPNTEISENYYHPGLKWSTAPKKHKMELDMWLPETKVAFELQGIHHYHDTELFFGQNSAAQKNRDKEKRMVCQREGIALVTVPYWWDTGLHSLSDLIEECT